MKTRFLPAVAATMFCAGALAIPSLAQDSSTDEPTSTEAPADAEVKADREAQRDEREAHYNELLAAELGISVDDLVAARENVKAAIKAEMRAELEERLAARVEAGEITQERADEILDAFDAGERPFDGRRPGRGHGPRGGGPGGPGGDAAAEGDAA